MAATSTRTITYDPSITKNAEATDKALIVEAKPTAVAYSNVSKGFTVPTGKDLTVQFSARATQVEGEPQLFIRNSLGDDIIRITYKNDDIIYINNTAEGILYTKNDWQSFKLVCKGEATYDLYLGDSIIKSGSLQASTASIGATLKKDSILSIDNIKAFVPVEKLEILLSAVDNIGNDITQQSTATSFKGKATINNATSIDRDVLLIATFFQDDILIAKKANQTKIYANENKTILNENDVNFSKITGKVNKIIIYLWENTETFRPVFDQYEIIVQ